MYATVSFLEQVDCSMRNVYLTFQRSRSWTATCSIWSMRTTPSSSKHQRPSERSVLGLVSRGHLFTYFNDIYPIDVTCSVRSSSPFSVPFPFYSLLHSLLHVQLYMCCTYSCPRLHNTVCLYMYLHSPLYTHTHTHTHTHTSILIILFHPSYHCPPCR